MSLTARSAAPAPASGAGVSNGPAAALRAFAARSVRVLRGRDALFYVVLLLLVWGLTVPLRGLWQDDTLLLARARQFQDLGFFGAFHAVVTPLRRLYTLPFRLALITAQPIWTLHLLYGLVWLAEALCAGWIVRLLVREHRLAPWLAVCLTLTATSDFLSDNLTSLGYNVAALATFLAFACALRYVENGRVAWVAASSAALLISIWTLDVALPAVPFLPLLLLWRHGAQAWRRSLIAVSAWGVCLAPVVPIEWRFLHDPKGYAAVALVPLALGERALRTTVFWLENFVPWRWAFARPVWYPRPAAVLPLWSMALAAGLAACWFALGARRRVPTAPLERARRALALVGLLALAALVSNAAYAGLQMAELRYRTHIVSRVWASLAVAIIVGWAVQRWPRWRTALLLVPTVFVGFGVWGGMERQDLWVGTWRLHQRELLSIVEAVPGWTPGTGLVLRSGATPSLYLATEADYLSASWMVLLYDAPVVHTLRLAPDRGTGCRAAADALECWHEGQAECVVAHTCAADRFPYDALVLLDFDARDGRYHLVESLAGDPMLGGTVAGAATYRPSERILRRPLTAGQRALLLQ